MIHRQLQKLLPIVVLGSKFKSSLQPDRLLGVYTHRFLESKQGNLRFRLIIDSQGFDPVRLHASFIRVEPGGRAFACTILHQSKKIPIHLDKLFDEHQVAYGSESLTEAHANLSGEQALVIRHTLLRDLFLVLRDLRAPRTTSEEFQWQRSPDINRVVPSIYFFQSTKSQRGVLPEASLRHLSVRHGDLLTPRQQGGIGSQSTRYEFRLGDSTLEIEEVTRWHGLDILRGERQRTCQRHHRQ